MYESRTDTAITINRDRGTAIRAKISRLLSAGAKDELGYPDTRRIAAACNLGRKAVRYHLQIMGIPCRPSQPPQVRRALPAPTIDRPPPPPPRRSQDELLREAREDLADVVAAVRRWQADGRTAARLADATRAVCEYRRKHGVPLVTVGDHRYGIDACGELFKIKAQPWDRLA